MISRIIRRTRGSIGLLVVIMGAVVLAGCSGGTPRPDNVTLNYWTVYNENAQLEPAITSFQAKYPYVTIDVKQLRPEEYSDRLIEAWGTGEGPDIFSVQNSHMGRFQKFIEPLPSTLSVTSVEIVEEFGSKEEVVTPQNLRTVSPDQLDKIFPEVVTSDAVLLHKGPESEQASDKIFGLPLSMDTLVMYYNKEMLNNAKIALPADSWEQLADDVTAMRIVDEDNNIIKSGAALGTAENVPRYFDILSLIMMQNGAIMTNGNSVVFDRELPDGKGALPGVEATEFYTGFANPDTTIYSWSEDQANALEAFINGDVGYFFGYYYHLEEIQRRGNELDFDIAPMPQINQATALQVNYANYWLESVSVNSPHTNIAWAFVEHMATEEQVATAMLEQRTQPAALKAVADDQANEDFVLSIFRDQTFTAESWYAGQKPSEAEAAFAELISLVNEERLDTLTAVSNTAEKIELTYE